MSIQRRITAWKILLSPKSTQETLNYILDNGVFHDDVELFAGQHVYKVDDSVIEQLREKQR